MRRERGSAAIAGLAGTLVLCLVALGVADLGAMLAARARAQAAADAAVLAAVVRQVPALGQEGDAEGAAREVAEANGAVLLRCACTAGDATAEVEVAVEARARFVPAWRGRRVRATARAEVDPDLLTYRASG